MSKTPFIVVSECAAVAHETNRRYCRLLGDLSHKAWEETSDDAKRVAYLSVERVAERDFNAEQLHQAWVDDKKAQGWAHGAAKDAVAKTHPCMVEFDKLPIELQHKDTLWVTTVKTFLSAVWRIPNQ